MSVSVASDFDNQKNVVIVPLNRKITRKNTSIGGFHLLILTIATIYLFSLSIELLSVRRIKP